MIPVPKPRGFWDYALFASVMTGALLSLFWLEGSDGVGWADAALAFTAAVLCVLAIVLVRRGEKATWIAQPTRYTYLLGVLGASGLVFGYVRRCPPAPSQGHHFQPTRTRHGVLRRIDSRDAVVLTKGCAPAFRHG